MKCQNCGHENAADARFCAQCGESLAQPCPNCSTLASPGDRFCRNCGFELITSETDQADSASEPEGPADDLRRYLPEELLAKMRSARDGHAMEGERRTVTMLFADVQGSTSSAEQLDPEDWAEIMNGAFERLISPIYRYEGTLAQLRGDAVLAFFGAPIAHEDDPVRALRAGLEIVESTASYSTEVERRWGVPAHVRVGIHTGLVVVGAMGSDLRVEYTALGDAINVAARMEQTAEPDTVRVTGHTLALTNHAFEAEELGPIDVKGKSDPVPAFRVVRYVGVAAAEEVGPMVGRATELAELDAMRGQVLGGTGRIASVIAEAGVGKTRILDEFARVSSENVDVAHHFGDPGQLNWLHASSRSYDTGRPYSTVADMLKHWWSPGGAEPGFDRVASAVAAEELHDPDVAAYLGFIAGITLPEDIAGFIQSLETQVLHAKANQAAVAYLKTVAERRPTIIVLEDLHWADDLSLALTETLMTLTESVPLGLLVAMRPYREEPTWRIHEVASRDHPHRYTNITLEPLDPEHSSELLETLLDGSSMDPSTKEGILERSQGNPLYLEQMVRALGEIDPAQFDETQVPSTLRGLLTARLDRLSEQQRYLVQMASVLGSEFDRGMLAVLADSPDVAKPVTDLLRVGILVERPEQPDSLAFRHALIQETAYETVLRRTRRQLHRRVADHLITTGGVATEIARHLVAADEVETAYPYLVRAGLDATRSMALADAIELLQLAIDNTPDDADPELIVQAHDALGDAYALIPDLSQAAASYQRLFDYGKTNARPEAQVSALNSLAYATASIGADLERANDYLAEAKQLAEECDDEFGLAQYHMTACFVASLAGNPGQAAAHDEETVRIGEQSGSDQVRLMGMVRRATNYVAMLDWEKGIPAVESALDDAAASGLEEAVATVRVTGSAMMKLARGDIRDALDELEANLGILDRYGSFFLAMGHLTLAQCHYELGSIEESLSHFLDARRTATAMGQTFTAAAGASGMALVYATVGLADQVPALRSEAEEGIGGPIGEFLASTVLADLGVVSSLLDSPERAVADFTNGLGAASTSQYIERPRLLIGRALASARAGNLKSAEADLIEAAAFVEEKELGIYLASLGLARGIAASKAGAIAAADQLLTAAQEEAMTRGQRLVLAEIMQARAELATATGDVAESTRHVEAARSVIDAMAGGMADEALRSSFVSRWQQAIAASPDRPGTQS